jgi:hypothetical protein
MSRSFPPRQPNPRAAHQRGIALLDLLLVVTILGIVTAIAVRAQDDDDLQLEAAARGVAADLLQAQELAIATQLAVGLWFDTSSHRTWFVIDDGDTPTEEADALRTNSDLDPREVERLIAATSRGETGISPVTIHGADFGGAQMAMFLADGSPRDAGVVELRRGRTWLRVRVQAATGRVTVTAP